MKKIFLSALVLLFFALSISIFQISCQKDADADTPSIDNSTQVNKIIYKKIYPTSVELWICNYDGSENTKVSLSLPNGILFDDESDLMLSSDGQKIFFVAGPNDGYGFAVHTDLYSCNINGSNLTKIVSRDGSDAIRLGDVK